MPKHLAIVALFPSVNRSAYVDHIARQIGELPTQDQRNAFMVSVIRVEFNRLLDAGIEQDVVEHDLKALADAVWMAVRGEQRGGAA